MIKLTLLIFLSISLGYSELYHVTSEISQNVQKSQITGWYQSRSIGSLVNCRQIPTFGPFGTTSNIKKTYSGLPPHYSASVSVEFIGIRSIDGGDDLFVDIDGTNVQMISSIGGWSYQNNAAGCDQGVGNSWDRLIRPYPLDFNITHTQSTIEVKFRDDFTQSIPDEGWSISRLDIFVDECHQTCLTCNGPTQNDCLTCPTGSTSFGDNECRCNGVTFSHNHSCVSSIPTGYLADRGNLVIYEQCNENCSDCTDYQICTTCNSGYYLSHGKCYDTCPTYTTLSGSSCVDASFNSNASNLPKVIGQEFIDKDFASADLKAAGWTFNKMEYQTKGGNQYISTSFSTDVCNGKSLALGYGVFKNSLCTSSSPCVFSKQFINIPAHHTLQVKVQFWAGGTWAGESMHIKLDGNTIKSQAHTSVSGTKPFRCALNQGYKDFIYDLTATGSHSSTEATISFEWTNAQMNLFGWAAFRDLQITAFQCDPKCATCSDSSTCITCIKSRTNAPSCDQPAPGYFNDGVVQTEFPQCYVQCGECSGAPDNCTKCKYYDDPAELPTCQKPRNCLVYGKVRSVGYQHYQSGGIGGKLEFHINDQKILEIGSRGITIVQLSQAAEYIEHQTFDTCGNIDSLDDIQTYVTSIPLRNIVMVGIYDEAEQYLSKEVEDTLKYIGWDKDINLGYRDAYAFIGRKVSAFNVPHAQMISRSDNPKYAAHVEECMLQCDWQCAECSGTPSNCTKCRYYTATAAPACGQPTNCLTYVKTQSADYESGNYYRTYINGSIPSGQSNARGMNLVIMSGDGTIHEQIRYDTCGSAADVTSFINKLNSLPDGRFVILGMKDEASGQLKNNAGSYVSMQQIGWPSDWVLYGRDPFSFIGIKGADSSSVLGQLGRRTDPGQTSIEQCIQDCPIKCATCSSSSACDTCSSNLRTSSCDLPVNCGKFAYIKSTGFHYSKYQSGGKQIQFYVNDIDVTFSQENGLHFILFDDQGQIDAQKVFDFSSDSTQLTAMINWIGGITNGRKVLVGCNGDMNTQMTSAGYTALQSLGLSNSVTIGFREPFVMYGEKGLTQGNAQYSTGVAIPGATEITVCALGCQYQCATCQMETYTCKSCSNSTRPNIPDCECADGKFDVGVPECDTCNYKCGTCVNNATNCLTCSDVNRVDDGVCDCKPGYYNVGTNKVCQKCPNKFETCTSETVGTKCQGTNRSTTIPDCLCNDKFFDNNSDANCVACTQPCDKCVDSATKCTSCIDGYYQVGNTCIQCPNKFETCTSETVGTKCQGTNRSTTIPDCLCNDKYFDNNSDANCVACTEPCDKCVDSATNCTSCIDGYYQVGNTCIQCPNKFETCTSETVGTKCQGTNRSANVPDCLCNFGFYDNNTDANCVSCITGCESCSSQNVCLTCNSGYYKNGDLCPICPNKYETCDNSTTGTKCQGANRTSNLPDCECENGYFDDGTNKADCSQCTSPCKTCIDNADKCQSCIDGYYLDGTDCIQCPNKYSKCSSPTVGIECAVGTGRTSNLPSCECGSGYFDDGTNNKNCVICEHPCTECENTASECTECHTAENRLDIPSCLCENGYFEEDDLTCLVCTSPCSKCVESTSNCTECINTLNRLNTPSCLCEDGYFENESLVCQICEYPCKKCTGTSLTCDECVAGLNRIQDSTCGCEDGFFDNGSLCEQCDLNVCSTCVNEPTECIICADHTRGGQDCDCLIGFFEQGVAECGTCEYQCESCSGQSDQCDSCSDINRIDDQVCGCKDTYYDDGFSAECQQCQFPCQNCLSERVCLTCQGEHRYAPNCQCSQGYFDNNNEPICEKCSLQCKQCIGQSDLCLVCNVGKRRTLQTPKCGCDVGYYQVEGSLDCEPCYHGCKECEDFTGICTVCNNEKFQLPDCQQENTQNVLSFEQISDSNNLELIVSGVCDFSCLSCEQTTTNCTSCKVGINRTQQIPNCQCLEGYHDNNKTTDDCFECSKLCKTCISQTQCQSCHVEKNRILNPVSLTCECQQGFTEHKQSNGECVPCYTYKGGCFQQCPKNTIEDNLLKMCIEQQIKVASNTQVLLTCFGILVVFQILMIIIIKQFSQKKLQKLQGLQKISQKEKSSDEENNSNGIDITIDKNV